MVASLCSRRDHVAGGDRAFVGGPLLVPIAPGLVPLSVCVSRESMRQATPVRDVLIGSHSPSEPSEERYDIARKELGLLRGSEVSAGRHHGPPPDVIEAF